MQKRRVEITPAFEDAYLTLSPQLQERVVAALSNFSEMTADNALRPELKNGFDNVWSIRISKGYRAFYRKLRDKDGAIFYMFHVGPHDDYKLLKRLAVKVEFKKMAEKKYENNIIR